MIRPAFLATTALTSAIMIVLAGGAGPAAACTGSSSDPAHCINNGQTINGFGGFFRDNLLDLPEVTSVSPGRNSYGTNPGTAFVLTFSEPMDESTVEDNFIIRSFTEGELYDEDTDGPGNINVWDDSAFDVDWNADDTEIDLTFEDERSLPTDQDTENSPDYFVTLNDGPDEIAQAPDGTPIQDEYFKLTDGVFEDYYKFSIQSDADRPNIDTVGAVTDETSAADGDEIRVAFNEPMVFYTLQPPNAQSGSTPPAPVNPPVTGETVANLDARVDGASVPVRIVRTESGETFALDPETGHNYGPIHESRSGFGWSFDGTPVPRPNVQPPSIPTRINRAVAQSDRNVVFTDGFESGDVSAWTTSQ